MNCISIDNLKELLEKIKNNIFLYNGRKYIELEHNYCYEAEGIIKVLERIVEGKPVIFEENNKEQK